MENASIKPLEEEKTAQNQSTSTSTSTNTQSSEKKSFEPIIRTEEELTTELKGLGGNHELWHLTYMMHAKEFFELREQKNENKLRIGYNKLCPTSFALSRLEFISRCTAELKNGYTHFSSSWEFSTDKLKNLCDYCTDAMDFCPTKVAAYIEHVCKCSGLCAENIYRAILEDKFEKKPEFLPFRELKIPEKEFNFIDAVCATAAAQLLKLKLIKVAPAEESKISYSYIPLCDKTGRSFISETMNFYRTGAARMDFLHRESLENDLCENRNCPDCLFPQCPDKIAAYFTYLSEKYGADPLEIAEYVITKNKISGITLRGNFRYYHNLRKLESIPFNPASRATLNGILRYIVNRFTTDSKVPFIPFNLVLYTKDEKLADETVEIFRDFLSYYCYYPKGNVTKVDYKFSEGGVEGLTKLIKDTSKNTVIHAKEFDLLTASLQGTSASKVTLSMAQLVNILAEKKDNICIVVSGEKAKLDTALNTYPDFYSGSLSHHLTISDMPTTQIVQAIIKELRDKYELESGFESALEYYVISKYSESTLKSKAFIDSVVNTILFNHYNKELNTQNTLLCKDIPLASNRRSDEEIWKDLNSLTGLENVKEEIRAIDTLLKFNKKMEALGNTSSQRPNMHMVFSGNPGTGKTTVARLLAEVLFNVGFIKQNKLVEVSAKDLIGQYIGHTAPKTAQVCESAYGGVLFIDEAYELTVNDIGNTSVFRSECISELIKQMEDNRDKLIVIFAGYTKEMENLIRSNAGFASRIGKIIEFEDYTNAQLVDMFVRLAHKNGLKVTENAKAAATKNIYLAKMLDNFGNGRYVRNLYEKAMMQHAINTINTDNEDILTSIDENDIPSM